jgi:hypothetical protein
MSPRKKSSPPSGKAPRSKSHPTHAEVEFRAYQMYLDRGGEHGRDVEDWLKAERELLKKYKEGRAKIEDRGETSDRKSHQSDRKPNR